MRRQSHWVGTRTALVVVLELAVGAGVARPASTAARRPEPGFAPAAGWHTLPVESISGPIGRAVSVANVAFSRADVGSSAPARTVAKLRKQDVLIWAQFQPTRRTATDNGFPPRRLPLRLNQAGLSRTPEGFAAPGRVLHLLARARAYDFFVYVFFGSSKPSAAARTAADAQLAKLQLPK